jgi:hypothetical protein
LWHLLRLIGSVGQEAVYLTLAVKQAYLRWATGAGSWEEVWQTWTSDEAIRSPWIPFGTLGARRWLKAQRSEALRPWVLTESARLPARAARVFRLKSGLSLKTVVLLLRPAAKVAWTLEVAEEQALTHQASEDSFSDESLWTKLTGTPDPALAIKASKTLWCCNTSRERGRLWLLACASKGLAFLSKRGREQANAHGWL